MTKGERHDRRRTRRFALSFSSSLPERSTAAVIDGIAAALGPGSSGDAQGWRVAWYATGAFSALAISHPHPAERPCL